MDEQIYLEVISTLVQYDAMKPGSPKRANFAGLSQLLHKISYVWGNELVLDVFERKEI